MVSRRHLLSDAVWQEAVWQRPNASRDSASQYHHSRIGCCVSGNTGRVECCQGLCLVQQAACTVHCAHKATPCICCCRCIATSVGSDTPMSDSPTIAASRCWRDSARLVLESSIGQDRQATSSQIIHHYDHHQQMRYARQANDAHQVAVDLLNSVIQEAVI
jgi:hypothetical protein